MLSVGSVGGIWSSVVLCMVLGGIWSSVVLCMVMVGIWSSVVLCMAVGTPPEMK